MGRALDNRGNTPSHAGWKLDENNLTDSLIEEGKIIKTIEWFRFLEQRRQLLKNLKAVENRIFEINHQIESRIVSAVIWGLALVCLIAICLVIYFRWRQKHQILEVKKQLASDLHDEVGSNLAGMRMMASTIMRKPDRVDTLGEHIQQTAAESAESLRDIIWLLAPEPGEQRDFSDRLHSLATILTSELEVDIQIDPACKTIDWPLHVRRELIFFYRESLQNINRHSEASEINIQLGANEEQLSLYIADNGKGLTKEFVKETHTLSNLKLRAHNLKATLKIETAPGKGLQLLLILDRKLLDF